MPEDDNVVPYFSLARFLGGSAPSLQHLCLDGFEYEGLPSLLSSATNLISLELLCIQSYKSPEVMLEALVGLTKLRDLSIRFSTELSTNLYLGQGPDSPPLHRVTFPALTKFQLGGDSEYLEDLVALIDAPRLEDLRITYYGKYYDDFDTEYYARYYDDFDTEGNIEASNLSQFIGRTPTFKHTQFRQAEVTLSPLSTTVEFGHPQGECQQARLSLTVSDEVSEEEYLETPFLATALDATHILTQLPIMLSDVQDLSIRGIGHYRQPTRFSLDLETYNEEDRILESGGLNVIWFQLLRSFPAVDMLHVSWKLAGSIALAINGAPESTVTRVLPALQTLWLDDLDKIRIDNLRVDATKQFLRRRKQSGRPVVTIKSHDQLVKRSNPQ